MYPGRDQVTFGAVIQGAEGLRLSPEEKALFGDTDPFGFILFAHNVQDADQLRALCGDFREAVGRNAPITIDQEGGRVQRLRPPLARQWMAPLDFVRRAGADAERAMYLRFRLIAAELAALGIDSNCAPMLDVAGPDTHEFLRNRCYGDTSESVARLGRAAARAMLDGGVLPVVKHMPGHGRSVVDSHHDLPRVSEALPQLKSRDFAPFAALNDLPMGMTAHIVFDALDDAPATLSSSVMSMIREEIGFAGLIMTDDISMKALSGSLAENTRDALDAGCDVVLHCNGTFQDRELVARTAGEMTQAAQSRAEAALAARRTPCELDIVAAQAELDGLMRGQGDDG